MLRLHCVLFSSFFFNAPATTDIYILSLHDALPIFAGVFPAAVITRLMTHSSSTNPAAVSAVRKTAAVLIASRSEEHTSELQSHHDLVCRLLLEKKKQKKNRQYLMPNIAILTGVSQC